MMSEATPVGCASIFRFIIGALFGGAIGSIEGLSAAGAAVGAVVFFLLVSGIAKIMQTTRQADDTYVAPDDPGSDLSLFYDVGGDGGDADGD
jgi:mannose/fructose/N-acetylgalactosamine-specific phosphotransferase system component IID